MAATNSVLIIGGSGFIGTHLSIRLRDSYKVFATYCRRPASIPGVTFVPFNVENRNWAKRVIYTTKPDTVVYIAGNNNKEWSEANARLAERLHAGGPATLATAADIMQPRFIYISNAYVFDGSRGNYHESDTALPANALGKMKLSGENVIKSKCLNYMILRTSPVFGRSGGRNLSFLDHLRMSLDRNQRFEAPTHELHAFATVNGLTELIARLITSGIRNRILHYGGLTKISFFEFARSFAKEFGYDHNLIVPRVSTNQKTSAHAYDFSLNSTQAAEFLKIKPLLLKESFDLLKQQLITHL